LRGEKELTITAGQNHVDRPYSLIQGIEMNELLKGFLKRSRKRGKAKKEEELQDEGMSGKW
jgi:hypothetical protein